MVVAYLMREEQIPYEEALAVVRRVNPAAEPNEGFAQQLKLYQAMGCRIDVNNPEYRQHLLARVASMGGPKVLSSGEPLGEPMNDGKLRSGETSDSDAQCDDEALEGEEAYVCRKCRATLATSSQVISHEPPDPIDHTASDTHRHQSRSKKWFKSQHKCSSLFFEPLKWMVVNTTGDDDQGQNEGKLHCHQCKARVGSFSWSGLQCSCARWVTPAFQIHKSKVDTKKVSSKNTNLNG